MVVLTYVFEKFLSAYSFIRPRKSFKIGVVEIVDFLSQSTNFTKISCFFSNNQYLTNSVYFEILSICKSKFLLSFTINFNKKPATFS